MENNEEEKVKKDVENNEKESIKNDTEKDVKENVEKSTEKSKNVLGKIGNFLKSHIKLILILVAIIIVVIIVIRIIAGGPERAVRNYVKAISDADVDKVIEQMDFRALKAWSECDGDEDDFQDAYDDIDVDDEDTKDEFDQAEKYFENLIDNITEANLKISNIEERYAFINIEYKKNALRIVTQNNYDNINLDSKNNIITSKKDILNHGIGLKSIKKIVNKYYGKLNINIEDKKFEIEIILFNIKE